MSLASSVAARWERFFFTGFSGESLGLLRAAIGAGLLIFHVSQFYSLLGLDPTGPGFHYLEPIWYFELLDIRRDVPWLDFALFALLMAATSAVMLGWRTRASIAVVLLCILYLKGVRDSYTGDVHHRYLIPFHVLLLLGLSKCGYTHSLDARRLGPRPVASWEASWPIKAMQVYIAGFYVASVFAKLRVSGWDWFESGGRIQEVLLRRSAMWGVTPEGEPLGNPLAFWLAHQTELLTALALLTFVMELGFPALILIRSARARLLALLGVTAFHVANFLLLYVGFLFLPMVFFAFFDLVPVWDWIRRRCGRRPDARARGRSDPAGRT
jgi:hypothetical protein